MDIDAAPMPLAKSSIRLIFSKFDVIKMGLKTKLVGVLND